MPIPTLDELRDQAQTVADELTELRSVEEPTDEQVARLDEIVTTTIPALRTQIEATEARDAALTEIRGFAAKPGHIEPGVSPAVIVKPTTDEIYSRSGMHVDNPANAMAYRDQSLRAIEGWRGSTDEYKASAEALVRNADLNKESRLIADHILDKGQPAYVSAFSKFIRGQGPASLPLMTPEESFAFADVNLRAINEGSVSAGQAIVPPFLDPAIILTNNGIVNPFRALSTVKTIATQTWKGVTSAGVTAEWTAEAAEMTDASPTFVQPSITPIRADAYIQASFESLEDSDLGTELAMLFSDARDRLEGTAFAVGTGSTQPTGVVTALQLVTASRTSAQTNGSVGAIDVFNLDTNMVPRYRANASFVAAKGILNVLRNAATGTSPQNASFWVDFGGAIPSKLIGYPIHEASAMQNTLSAATASNDDVLVLGDFRNGFYIVDRIGMAVSYNPLVLGTNRRPTGEAAWAAFWRVGSNVVSAAAFQMLRV